MPRLRDADGNERLDEIRQPLYDTITQASGESPVATRSFFSAVTGKNQYQTNLRQNNLLEASVSYRVMGLAFDSQNSEEVNRRVLPLIMERSFIQFTVGEKIYWAGNAVYVAGRLDQVSSISRSSGTGEAAGTVVERVYQKYGDQAVQGVALTGQHVVDIPPLQSFKVDWIIPSGAFPIAADLTNATPSGTITTGINYTFSLKGLQRRPVQ